MPLYEFICLDCERDFEELVMGERVVKCPECGSESVKKKVSVFAYNSEGASSAKMSSGACSSCSTHSCSTCGH